MAVICKPDKATLTNALNNAELLRERENDPHSMGHVVLYLAERNRKLEAIAHAAQEYTRFGEDALLHQKLVKTLHDFENYEREAELAEPPRFGLD